MINNLFSYATKELSQDAFICWLCSFDLEESVSDDEVLKECAHHFIFSMLFDEIGAENEICTDFALEKIERQVGNIDVLLTVKTELEIYKIIIEDKTFSVEHDNQLQRYKENLKNKSESFEPVKVIGLYYKTGFQSSYENVRKAGYKIFDRKKILELLAPYSARTNNQILGDYYTYWKNFDNLSTEYIEKPLDEWGWQTVNGFFGHVQNMIGQKPNIWCNYDWVHNKSGGFWGMWYGSENNYIQKDDVKAELYLQVEIKWDENQNQYVYKNCLKFFKASGKDSDYEDILRCVIDNMLKSGFYPAKKKGHGKHITIGVYCDQNITLASEMENNIFKALECYKALMERM